MASGFVFDLNQDCKTTRVTPGARSPAIYPSKYELLLRHFASLNTAFEQFKAITWTIALSCACFYSSFDMQNDNRQIPKERQDIHNSDVPVLCHSCEARHKGICGVLSPEQLVELSKHTVKHDYKANKHLASDGEKLERYSNILTGVVKLSKLTVDGRQQIVGLQFAPDLLGRPFIKNSDVEIESATDVKVCSFPRSVLEKLVKESSALEHRIHEQTLKELDEARNWMLTLGRKSASEKVASFLYYIATHVTPDPLHQTEILRFDLPLSRSDIADFLGLTIETVSRHFTKLRQLGVINVVNNRIVEIPELNRLKAMTEVDHA